LVQAVIIAYEVSPVFPVPTQGEGVTRTEALRQVAVAGSRRAAGKAHSCIFVIGRRVLVSNWLLIRGPASAVRRPSR